MSDLLNKSMRTNSRNDATAENNSTIELPVTSLRAESDLPTTPLPSIGVTEAPLTPNEILKEKLKEKLPSNDDPPIQPNWAYLASCIVNDPAGKYGRVLRSTFLTKFPDCADLFDGLLISLVSGNKPHLDTRCRCKTYDFEGTPHNPLPVKGAEARLVIIHAMNIINSYTTTSFHNIYSVLHQAYMHCAFDPLALLSNSSVFRSNVFVIMASQPGDKYRKFVYAKSLSTCDLAPELIIKLNSNPINNEIKAKLNVLATKFYPDIDPYSSEPEIIPHMDNTQSSWFDPLGPVRELGNKVEKSVDVFTQRMASLESKVEAVTPDLLTTLHNVQSLANEGLQTPGIDKLGDTINSAAEKLSNIKIDHSGGFMDRLWGAMSSITGSLGKLFNMITGTVDTHRKAFAFLAIGVLEAIRLKCSKSKWSRLLLCAIAAIAYKFCGTYSLTILGAYYGVQIYDYVRKWMSGFGDDDEEEEAEEETYTIDPSKLQNDFIPWLYSSIVEAITGVTSAIGIREVLVGVASYRALITGGRFVIDSVVNAFMDLVNLLGSPFGIKFFKKAYTKYPQMFTMIETLNDLKEKVSKKAVLSKLDVDAYINVKTKITALELTIPINQENTVYRNALEQIKKMADSLSTVLKGLGYLSLRRRIAPYVFTILGPSGTAKTRLVDILLDILMSQLYGVEMMETIKENPTAHVYSMQAGKKHHDGCPNNVKAVKIDDMGQIRKAVDPQQCPMVQLVSMANNEAYILECAELANKDNKYFAPDIIGITSNMKSYSSDNFHCVEPEAPIRRMECNNHCSYVVELKDEYKLKADNANHNSKAWGYAVSKDLKKCVNLNVDAFLIVPVDFRTGEPVEGRCKMTWREFVKELVTNCLRWNADEKAKMAVDDEIWTNPDYNPFAVGPTLKAHMDEPRSRVPELLSKILNVYSDKPISEADDFDHKLKEALATAGISSEELLVYFADKEMVKRKPKRIHISNFATVHDFALALEEYYKDVLRSYHARGGDHFITQASRLLWGHLGDYKWANFMKGERVKRAGFYSKQPVYTRMLFSPGTIDSATEYVANPVSYGKMWYYYAIDVYDKLARLSKLLGKTYENICDIFDNTDSWKQFFSMSFDTLASFVSSLYLETVDLLWNTISVFCIGNFWVDIATSLLVGFIAGSKAVEVIAQGDYQKAGRILKGKLDVKCKNGKMLKKHCTCVDCTKLRDSMKICSNTKKLSSDCSCVTCLPKNIASPVVAKSDPVPMFSMFNENAEQKIKGIQKRNVWNMQLLTHPNEDIPLLTMNMLVINSKLAVTNDHFVEAANGLLVDRPAMILRLVSWDSSRKFDMLYRSMVWDRIRQTDKAFWLNDGLCSFGGGIRDITEFFISEHARPVNHGRAVVMKYDRDLKSIEYNIIPCEVGKTLAITYKVPGSEDSGYTYKAYPLDFASFSGNCGSPIISADAGVKDAKIFAILSSGYASDEGRALCYAAGITREEVVDVMLRNNLFPFNTSNLPYSIEESEIIPHGCLVIREETDTHSVMTHNSIKKTPLYGCVGDLDKIPTYLAPWEMEGEVFDPVNKTRLKYVTNAPAINPSLYLMSVGMYATLISNHLGNIPRAFRLTTMEALEGAADESRFSTKTSPGGKYICQGITKKDIVKLDGEKLDFSSPYGQAFLSDIEKATSEREDRIISVAITNEFAKAEVLPAEKVLEGKVRIVNGDDADQVIADKKELACVSYLMKKVGISSGSCIGKDPLSYDYDLMARMLLIWNNVVPGDHSGWDTNYFRYKYQGVLAFMRMILHDAEPLHLAAIETCVENMMYRIHMAHITYDVKKMDVANRRVFYELLHTMISGSYGTLLFNTIGHSIDFRYMVLCNYVEKVMGVHYLEYEPSVHGVLDFMDIETNLMSFILGDDILASVTRSLRFIDFASLRDMYANHNMKFTTDKKGDDESGNETLVRFSTNLSTFGFCKRNVRWCPEHSRYVWPLEWTSLLKSIYYSEDFSDYKQVIDKFFQELSLHGKPFFEDKSYSLVHAVQSVYGYTSPFSVYDIALMAATSGLSKVRAADLYLAVTIGDLDACDITFYHIKEFAGTRTEPVESIA